MAEDLGLGKVLENVPDAHGHPGYLIEWQQQEEGEQRKVFGNQELVLMKRARKRTGGR